MPDVLTRTPLYGIPCPVCGLPATAQDSVGGWTRIHHVQRSELYPQQPCDIGTVPKEARRVPR